MLTKYMLSGKEIVPIQIEFEDSFKVVFFRSDICGKFTLYKENDTDNLFPIFNTIDELIEYRTKKVEKEVMDLQLKLKTICEEHAEFLRLSLFKEQ